MFDGSDVVANKDIRLKKRFAFYPIRVYDKLGTTVIYFKFYKLKQQFKYDEDGTPVDWYDRSIIYKDREWGIS